MPVGLPAVADEGRGGTVARILDRLGRRAVRHRWWFIAAWVAVIIGAIVLAASLGGTTVDTFKIPGAQSQQALDLLSQKFSSQSGSSATIVFDAPSGVDDASVEPAIQQSITQLQAIDGVTSVSDPYGPLAALIVSDRGPTKGQLAMVTVQFADQVQQLPKNVFQELETAVAPAVSAGVRVEYGGAVTDFADRPPASNADLIGLLAAVVILLLAFGSVVAMGLPILTALVGLGVGLTFISIVSAFTDIGTLAPTLATMIGLGVGIDYSLFIVTRFREGLATGLSVEEAVGRSVSTAGSAVLFAGCTVVIAICGLAISGIPYVARLGYMSGMVVAVMMAAALTLLPAIIGVDRPPHRQVAGAAVRSPALGLDGTGRRVVELFDLGTMGTHGGASRMGVRDPCHRDPRHPGLAVDQHAARPVRRRQPPVVDDATPGLRPDRRRFRTGHQRTVARGRGSPGGR